MSVSSRPSQQSHVAWNVTCRTASDATKIRMYVKRLLNGNNTVRDKRLYYEGKQRVVSIDEHRLEEYFNRVELIPEKNSRAVNFTIDFYPRPDAKKFWKDLMVSILGGIREAAPGTQITRVNATFSETITNGEAARHSDTRLIASYQWVSRLGNKSRKFWQVASQYLLTHESFTFDDLARATRIPKASLKSMHRNSYRAIKAEIAQNPLKPRWDWPSGRNIYWMEPDVRDVLLDLTDG